MSLIVSLKLSFGSARWVAGYCPVLVSLVVALALRQPG
jgi:hypothetical protein